MIKVLYLPLNSQEVVQTGMYDGFRNSGVDLKIFDFNIYNLNNKPHKTGSNFINIAKSFKPDLIHMQLQFTSIIDPKILSEIKRILPNTIISNWTGDVRTNVPKTYINTSKYVDFNLISSVGQIGMYNKAIGKKVYYFQIGYNPKLYFPKFVAKNEYKWHTSFLASYHKSANFPGLNDRLNTVKVLKNKFDKKFGLFGMGWPKKIVGKDIKYISQTKANDVYNDSFSCISVSNFNNLSHYFSDRLLMCLASGRPTISLYFPGWESYFTDGVDIVIAKTVNDIPKKVDWLLANPDKANAIGKAGAKKVLAEHTYTSRVLELLNIVGLR